MNGVRCCVCARARASCVVGCVYFQGGGGRGSLLLLIALLPSCFSTPVLRNVQVDNPGIEQGGDKDSATEDRVAVGKNGKDQSLGAGAGGKNKAELTSEVNIVRF